VDPEPRPTRRPEDDPGWACYGDTVIEFRRGRRRTQLDCRVAVDVAVRDALVQLGLAGPFVVLTACNPGGSPAAAAEDRRRTARLARRLRGHGLRPVRADGGSPDRAHVEPGWAVAMDLAAARRLAAADGQSAIFRFDGARMWIEPVLVDADPIALPRGAVAGA
jgi:hypothetical protein